jgi:hypothetical protein
MRSDVLQAVAICCHGNAFLQNAGGTRAPELFGANATFQPVLDLCFERNSGGAHVNGKLAIGTSPWLRRMQAEGVESLKLHLGKAAIDPEQRNESGWGIVSDGKVGVELWQPTWKGRLTRYDQPTTWSVTYVSSRFSRWTLVPSLDRHSAYAKMNGALQGALELARDAGRADLIEPLAQSLMLQFKAAHVTQDFNDLYPPTMCSEAKQLCAVALRSVLILSSAAWAEALITADERAEEFACVTQVLWQAALAGFESAVNC